MQTAPSLRTTPLNSAHRALGARMVDFGGWDMPVQYSGIIEEHHAVRTAAGLFDVSHMGEIDIRGPEAARLTDHVTTNAVQKLKPAFKSGSVDRVKPNTKARTIARMMLFSGQLPLLVSRSSDPSDIQTRMFFRSASR